VQVLPTALDPVMDRLVRCPAGRTCQAPRLTLDGKVDGALRPPEIHRSHRPRRTQAQSLREERFHPATLPHRLRSSKAPSTRSAIDPIDGTPVCDALASSLCCPSLLWKK